MKQLLNDSTILSALPVTGSLSSLNSIKEFYQVIGREIKRADRYGLRLSLAVFEVSSSDENNVVVRRLVRALHKRIRSADAFGWYAKKQIGVLLPHTPEHGAWKVTEDIYGMLSSSDVLPPYTVYTYPSANWPVKIRKTVFAVLGRISSLFTISAGHTIPNANETRALLDLEMDRAVRHNYIFSLLILELDLVPKAAEVLRKVVRAINTCLRDTDSFGWFKDRSLAIILPYSSEKQAKEIGLRISARSDLEKSEIFKIYTYPTNWYTDTGVSKKGMGSLGSKGAKSSPEGDSGDVKGETSPERFGGDDASEGASGDDRLGSSPSEIDSFIAKPIPFWKRGMDVTGALIGLFFLAPVFLIAAIGIKLSSPGPLLFRQERVGYQKKLFPLYKFRSMHVGADAEHHRKFMEQVISNGEIKDTKLKDDPRIFPFGKFLRKSSIDELPQLVNVLKGEMSLVGPRPCMDYEADHYLRWHTKRFYAMPGLSGLWQVSGKNLLSFKEMIRLDIHYQKHMSVWLDLKIILKTFPAVLGIFFKKNDLA